MTYYTTTIRLALTNILFLGLVVLGTAYGYVAPIFANDHSRLTIVCAVLMTLVIGQSFIAGRKLDGYLSDPVDLVVRDSWTVETMLNDILALPDFLKSRVFLYLGLAGTVIGLSLFAQHMALDSGKQASESIAATIAAMKGSMETAFYATLVGIVCKVWTEVLTYIQGLTISRLVKAVGEARTLMALRKNRGLA